jgi:hypothetical protein
MPAADACLAAPPPRNHDQDGGSLRLRAGGTNERGCKQHGYDQGYYDQQENHSFTSFPDLSYERAEVSVLPAHRPTVLRLFASWGQKA